MADAQTAGNGAHGSFTGKLAAVTGGGSSMGRKLVRQLAAQGCSVAACDWHADAAPETAALARAGVPHGVRVTSHACDVGDEAQVLRFRDELFETHGSDHVNLVFAQRGPGGGASFVSDSRQESRERTFRVERGGCITAPACSCRSSSRAATESWSTPAGSSSGRHLGPGGAGYPRTGSATPVRGFSEALMGGPLRVNAPQVRVAVVMPGHVGTDILVNTRRAHGQPGPETGNAELGARRPG